MTWPETKLTYGPGLQGKGAPATMETKTVGVLSNPKTWTADQPKDWPKGHAFIPSQEDPDVCRCGLGDGDDDAELEAHAVDVSEHLSEDELTELFAAVEASDFEKFAEIADVVDSRVEAAESSTDEAPEVAVEGEKVAGQEATPKDAANTQRLRDYWAHGKGALKIRWGTKGDFSRCVRLVSKYMTPSQAKGFCNLEHKRALGFYPSTHAKMDRAKSGKKSWSDVAPERQVATATEGKAAVAYSKGDMVKVSKRDKLPTGVSPMGIVMSSSGGKVKVKHATVGGGEGSKTVSYDEADLKLVRKSKGGGSGGSDSGGDSSGKPPWLQKKALLTDSLESLSDELRAAYAGTLGDVEDLVVLGTYPESFTALVVDGENSRTVNVPYSLTDEDITFGEAADAEVPDEVFDALASSEVGEAPTDDAEIETEVKGLYLQLAGSWEDTQRKISRAISDAFDEDGRGEGGEIDWDIRQHAMVQATYDDHVIISMYGGGIGYEDNDRYLSVPYTIENDEVTLGDPSPVKASVVVDAAPATSTPPSVSKPGTPAPSPATMATKTGVDEGKSDDDDLESKRLALDLAVLG